MLFRSAWIQCVHGLHAKWFNALCGTPPFLRPWHFQWHAIKDLNKDLKKVLPLFQGKVLDFGCGLQPYRDLMVNADECIGVDIQDADGVDYLVKPGDPLPFEKGAFDAVLSTQVLEHVADMDDCIAEIHRVLKPGGQLVISVPFIYQVHGKPHDYRRLSEFGVKQALSGFRIERMSRQGGVGSSMAILFLCWLHHQMDLKTWTWLIKVCLSPVLIVMSLIMNMLGVLLDYVDTTESVYGNLLVVAVREPDGA